MIILSLAILYVGTLLIKEKRRCSELESHLTMAEKVLEDFRTIRHQYNNIFQSAVFYIENEQWVSDKNFITEIMAKTSELNRNNTVQLVKIKNRQVRDSVFQMGELCSKNGIDFNLAVLGEINRINMRKSALGSVLETIFNHVFNEVIGFDKKEIDIEINSDRQGIAIIFASYIDSDAGLKRTELAGRSATRKTGTAAIRRIMARNKNVIYNSYIDSNYHRQEIMIM
ncbi:MAG: hypothetical protein VB084_09435 [Syntrophomonadaceae bacterium]|nr:hypothetical protein [Syntrophomonadaceae bacterium]